MNKIFISLLIISGFYCANSMSEDSCATEQCENAQSLANLPADIKFFITQRDGCDHFRGEPWPEGDEQEARQRREFIAERLKALCTGTDSQLGALRSKYHLDPAIVKLLNEYEEQIE